MPRLRPLLTGAAMAMLLAAIQSSQAGPLRDRIMERRAVAQGESFDEDEDAAAARLPAGIRIVRDVAYGDAPEQRFDVYAPAGAKAAPVILMVHGGGWARGDKAMRGVVENKVARWVPRGFIVISANYRMIPKAEPLEQARDVARALAKAQQRAGDWGGDGKRVILMGHSAGAHLVALLTASSTLASDFGAAPWLGTVALDSAAFDLVQLMESRHFALYDRAFGQDPQTWRAASPFHALAADRPPLLAVCSTQRAVSCSQAEQFAAKAKSLGNRVQVLGEGLTHGEINKKLGESGNYTEAVESFLASLDPANAKALAASIGTPR